MKNSSVLIKGVDMDEALHVKLGALVEYETLRLEPEQVNAVREHLNSCPLCRERLQVVRDMADALTLDEETAELE